MGIDASVHDFMARQDGVISRGQALAMGMSLGQIRTSIEGGLWREVASGVYASSSAPNSWQRRLRAALLDHPKALAAGRSAAFLHGFTGVLRSRPEILVPYGADSRSSLGRVIRGRHFDSVASVVVSGFPSTSVAETILTLSLTNSAPAIERFVDDQLVVGALAVADFHPIFDRLEFARQPGLRPLRRIVSARADDAYQPPTTELERLLYRLLDRPELPPYDRQLPINYPQMTATVDAYIDAWHLIVEGDGRRWHDGRQAQERDRLRDAEALAAGLAVLRLSWKMLRYEPEECLRRLIRIGKARTVVEACADDVA